MPPPNAIQKKGLYVIVTGIPLRPGHSLLYGTKSREDNSKTKNARVVFLVHDTSSQCDACTCKVS